MKPVVAPVIYTFTRAYFRLFRHSVGLHVCFHVMRSDHAHIVTSGVCFPYVENSCVFWSPSRSWCVKKVKVKVKQSHYTHHGGARGEELQLLLILDLGTRWEWVVSGTPRPRFNPGERTTGTHCTGGWVGPRAGLDTKARGKILPPLARIEPRSPGRPVHSQTLCWMSYPSSDPGVYVMQFCKNFISRLRIQCTTKSGTYTCTLVQVKWIETEINSVKTASLWGSRSAAYFPIATEEMVF
jgi:hypothetical protein